MPQWTKKILRKKGGIGTVTDVINGLAKIRYKDSEVPELTNSFLQHWLEADIKLSDMAGDLTLRLNQAPT